MSASLALVMAIFLLSLTGIPPLAGFVGKYYLFAAAIQSKLITLVVFAAINSAVAAYYYFKVIRIMYLDEGDDVKAPIGITLFEKVALGICVLLTLLLGILPNGVMEFLQIVRVF